MVEIIEFKGVFGPGHFRLLVDEPVFCCVCGEEVEASSIAYVCDVTKSIFHKDCFFNAMDNHVRPFLSFRNQEHHDICVKIMKRKNVQEKDS